MIKRLKSGAIERVRTNAEARDERDAKKLRGTKAKDLTPADIKRLVIALARKNGLL